MARTWGLTLLKFTILFILEDFLLFLHPLTSYMTNYLKASTL